MEKLSQKQARALEIINKKTLEQGYPPTIKELASELGAASQNSAVKYLTILARKGYLVWERNKARGIQLAQRAPGKADQGMINLPLIGAVTAGLPMLAEQNIEAYVAVPRSLVRPGAAHFLLRINGRSMTGAGILHKDLVIVRSQNGAEIGDIVVALINGEATVKRLAGDQQGKYLKAENPEFPDIHPHGEWMLQGKVVALVREQV
jgi:repressor LexA